ncbi:MAG: tetratricopeptide repeat-containing sulfotransferase family protein [Planctomycetota bacterium]|jgi:tetratricopeptide (TPR) repeat protein
MGRLQKTVQWRQAQQAFNAAQWDQARHLCGQLLQQNANNADVLVMLGRIAVVQARFEEAASHMLRAAELQPEAALPHVILGEIRTAQGQFDEAVAEFDKALQLEPQHPTSLRGKADAYEKSGQRDKARALLRPFIEAGRETATQAVIQARLDLHDRNYDAVIELTTRHIESREARGQDSPNLSAALGRALEARKRFDEAFAAWDRANHALPVHFDLQARLEMTDAIIESFSPQRFAQVPRGSHGSQVPILAFGMPRSGTTLVEAILDAHPDVAGAGELSAVTEIANSISLDIGSTLAFPACIEDLDQADVDTIAGTYLDRLHRAGGQAKRLVDKSLDNYMFIGLLAVLFPQARFVHCRRHPLDTCLSCFQVLSVTVHPYKTNLRTLGAVYLTYERLMAHWRDVLKIPMLDVQYEAMVADPEGMTRRLLDFCGLDFDDRCLRFYESERVALTASYDQVNRPVYSSSVGRYKNYEKHLGPLKEALAEGGWTEEAFERAATRR